MHEILFPFGIPWSEEREKNEGCDIIDHNVYGS